MCTVLKFHSADGRGDNKTDRDANLSYVRINTSWRPLLKESTHSGGSVYIYMYMYVLHDAESLAEAKRQVA